MRYKNKIIKTQKIKELIKGYKLFDKHFKALKELGAWLNENNINYYQSDDDNFKVMILEKDTEKLRAKIRKKIKEIENKYKLYGYREGASYFTFGF